MKKVLYSTLIGSFILSNYMACTPNISGIEEADPSIIPSAPTLIEAVKTENPWLGLFNTGDITIRVKPDREVLPEKPAKAPDLSKLQKEPGKFRLVSVGGALSAGFRDGGLYREGQLTAFPNLVARQMGISFVQPLFSEAEGNGTGYKTVAGTGPLVSFKMVTNNLGVKSDGGETSYSKFNGTSDIDQMAFPDIPKGLQYFKLSNSRNKGYKYIDRVANEAIKSKYKTPSEWIEAQNADLFIFELGLDDTYFAITGGGGTISGGPLSGYVATTPEFILMKSLVNKKNKIVLLNVPNLLETPYFQQITEEKIKKTGLSITTQISSGSKNYRPYDASIDRIIPTDNTEKIFNGELKGIVKLQDEDVISEVSTDREITMVSPVSYNTFEIERQAQLLNLPVVDIYSLYKRILAGNYVTDDGVAVSPAWPKNGNFFSADGIYPTAFGQAVIANEVIKTLNRHYGLEIPLVQTRFFVGK